MVKAYEKRVVWIAEKRPDGVDLSVAGLLLRPGGVEADDDEGVDAGEEPDRKRPMVGLCELEPGVIDRHA